MRKEEAFTPLTSTVFDKVVQSLEPSGNLYTPRVSDNERTQATNGTLVKPPSFNQESKSAACPKCRCTDPTHTCNTCQGRKINKTGDVLENQEGGQVEFDLFDQDHSDHKGLDIQAIGMCECKSNISYEDARYCYMMTITRPPFLNQPTEWGTGIHHTWKYLAMD